MTALLDGEVKEELLHKVSFKQRLNKVSTIPGAACPFLEPVFSFSIRLDKFSSILLAIGDYHAKGRFKSSVAC